ncbi:MAG: rRNA pseudouridine synthase [Proteobacteria bacterium]|nr:rRNA pseudouridine synthase [Pseudomonadota bacterium]
MTEIRLQRYLSQAGVAARRKAEALITRGEVTVNGRVVTELGSKVVPGRDRVQVNGKAVYPQELFYAVLNKPKGCITAVSDPENRPTVMEYLHKLPVNVAPVGRLDFYSEGVLLLTNDGELSARLQSPDSHVEKTYHVKVRGRLSERHLDILRSGVRLDDRTLTRPAQVDFLPAKSRHQWLVVTLSEGKSRQIHRMFEALGFPVLKLQRVAYAGIPYHGLRVGDARELTQVEVNQLRAMVGLAKNTVARGKWQSRREETELGRRARARARARAEALGEASAAAGKRSDGKSVPGKKAGRKPIAGKPSGRTYGRGTSGKKARGPGKTGRPGASTSRGRAGHRAAKPGRAGNKTAPSNSRSTREGRSQSQPGRSKSGHKRKTRPGKES